MIEMGIHEGHRERLRESFFENGLDCFNDINALELLLFYAIPRRDTNELAHRLLEHFGSLEAVLFASKQELMAVEGIGESAAGLIMLVPKLYKKSKISKANDEPVIHCGSDAARYMMPRFMDEQNEVLMMMCLDPKKEVISCKEVGRGVVNSVETNVRKLVEIALKCNAHTVIVAHNHPNGHLQMSREDENFTRTLYKSLSLLGIELVDHIIFSGKRYVSFADSGVMSMLRR